MNSTQTEQNHAIQNGRGWLSHITEKVIALAQVNHEVCHQKAEAIIEEMQEWPLEVSVRSDWHAPGTESTASEFLILLSTGGPALRIIGDLNSYSEPENPKLQWQDWGTPWTDLPMTDEETEAVQTFCQQFYFGE